MTITENCRRHNMLFDRQQNDNTNVIIRKRREKHTSIWYIKQFSDGIIVSLNIFEWLTAEHQIHGEALTLSLSYGWRCCAIIPERTPHTLQRAKRDERTRTSNMRMCQMNNKLWSFRSRLALAFTSNTLFTRPFPLN